MVVGEFFLEDLQYSVISSYHGQYFLFLLIRRLCLGDVTEHLFSNKFYDTPFIAFAHWKYKLVPLAVGRVSNHLGLAIRSGKSSTPKRKCGQTSTSGQAKNSRVTDIF